MALALGLGTMDMPVPSVAGWEWLNWKFPRQIKAGETIYARWTLTQKRPSVGGAPTAIVVWRVDVYTLDGALCAEGEVGASVRRTAQAARSRTPESAPAAPVPASRRRRGRRSPAAAKPADAAAAPPPEAPKPIADKTGPARRRRRRRPRSGAASGQNGQPAPSAAAAADPAPPPAAASVTASPAAPPAGRLSRVIKRLRRP